MCAYSKETGENYSFKIYETEGVQPYYGLDFALGISPSKRLPKVGTLPVGTYVAFLGSKAHSDVEYQAVRSSEGTIAYEITINEDGSIDISDPMKMVVVTGIVAPKVNQLATKGVYDLQGRRVADTQRHGIYIIDGKKVVK